MLIYNAYAYIVSETKAYIFFTEERSCFRVRVVKYIFVSNWDIRHDAIRIETKLEGESFSH